MEAPTAQSYQFLFDHLADGVCLSDPQGKVFYANLAARGIIGEELEGRRLCEVLCARLPRKAGPAPCPEVCGDACAFSGRVGRVTFDWREERVQRSDHARDLRVRCLAQPGLRMTIIEDVSAQAELGRYKEDWRHMIAHDLRSPMTGVYATLKLLEACADEGTPLPGGWEKIVTTSVRSCDRMLELLDLYLEVAKLDAGLMAVKLSSIAVAPAAREACDELRTLALQLKVELRVDAPEDLTAVADPRLLHRVLQNLLSNALKFSPAGAPVSVAARREDDWVLVSVADAGKGIEPADLPRIFDRYYQAEARRGGKVQGTGLGLAFCQLALQCMGGRIAVASTPGVGSVFTAALRAGTSRSAVE